MKKPLFTLLALLFSCCVFAQYVPKSIVSTSGSAQKVFYPIYFKIRFTIEEDVNSPTNDFSKPVSKTSIDSLKQLLFQNLKAYGFAPADLKLIKETSVPINNYSGRPATNLYASIYDLDKINATMAEKIIRDLRFGGLKGAIAKAQYTSMSPMVQDSLYKAALGEALKNATYLAKQAGKTVGDVDAISNYTNLSNTRDLFSDYEPEDIFGLAKFEMVPANERTMSVSLNVSYLLVK